MTTGLRSSRANYPSCARRWACCCVLVFVVTAVPAATNTQISTWLADGTINWGIWGHETNGLCAGVLCASRGTPGKPTGQSLTVYVLTSNTNTAWKYLGVRDAKLSKFELRSPTGALMDPLPGKRIDRELRDRMLVSDLPRARGTLSARNMPDAWLFLTPGSPTVLADVTLQDLYCIEKEGQYAVTIWPAIYEFTPDRRAVFRIDLPCVSTTIHLSPSVKHE
jgi:hypothetical protein